MYQSEYCEVSYNTEYNVVFVKWKKSAVKKFHHKEL